MQRFIIFATTVLCLVLSSEARSFRGGLMGFLKGQDPTEIGGNPEATGAQREGDIRHISAYSDNVKQTAEIIQRDLTNGLRADFPFLKSALTTFADSDGIVREGIYFCGNNDTTTPFEKPTNYSDATGLLGSEKDGFGYVDTYSAKQEIRTCGRNLCEAGSFIDVLANRIRSLGYHVQHADLCQARASSALSDTDFPRGRTCMLQAQPSDRKSYSCNATRYEHGLDFFQVNRQCFGLNSADCATNKVQYVDANGKKAEGSTTICEYDAVEAVCRAKNSAFTSDLVSAAIGPACEEKVAEKITGEATVNVIRRAPSYSVKENGKVDMDDVIYVSGTPDDECRSLRNYIGALNGNAMISAFRDDNIQQAESYWLATLKEARSFVKSYAAVLKNFRDISVTMFPEIEYEEFEECAMGETAKSGYNSGNRTNPMCDDSRYTGLKAMSERDRKSQFILRKNCFCRAGTLNGAYVSEADDIYLRPDLNTSGTDCDTLKAELPSVYQYCKGAQFSKEEKPWQATLKSLQPQASRIHVFGNSETQKASRDAIEKSLTARIDVDYTCGRTVNADNTTFLRSNKGGNCMPFSKLHEVLYKLEFGTSKRGVGESSIGQANAPTEGSTKFEEMFCKESFQLSNTEFSFRQLAYKWNHAQTKTDDGAAYEPRRDDTIYDKYLEREFTNQIVVDRQRFTTTNIKDFCFIDWNREFAGSSDRRDFTGTKYQNPYDLFSREVDEAIFGAQVAVSAKARVIEDNALLWAAIEEELTSQSESRIAYQISVEAAEHFMRIVTTDTDGNDIDLDGTAAPAANKNVSETNFTGVTN
jgi:hypothetical protein